MRRKRDYGDQRYTEWRQKIRKRDKRICQMPGCSSRKKLQCHHIHQWIHAPSLRFDVRNGILLCKWCHKKVTGHERLYAKTFSDIVKEKDNG